MIPNKAMKIFKALGEETKFFMIRELLKGELFAYKISSLIKKTQSNTSMHLTKLRDLGFVKSKRKGRRIIYSIIDKDIKSIMGLVK